MIDSKYECEYVAALSNEGSGLTVIVGAFQGIRRLTMIGVMTVWWAHLICQRRLWVRVRSPLKTLLKSNKESGVPARTIDDPN